VLRKKFSTKLNTWYS